MPKTIAISAGHQPGLDNGAASGGLLEANLTIQIADRVVDVLRKHGVPVLYVPNNISLTATIGWINDRASQINGCAIDIHINSGGGTGWEAFYDHPGNNQSSKLAQFMVDALVAEAGLKSRGIKSESATRHGKLGFISDTRCVASLVECGFIDTAADRKLLSTADGINRIAKGVARGALGYIGVAWNPGGAPTPTTESQKLAALKAHVWYDNAWWGSLYRVKKMREILPR
jgi:N-acetylmuramoyl-L-alanine amidase